MSDDNCLTLPEQVLVLALNPSTEEIPAKEVVNPLFAAAILLELTCQGRIISEGRASFFIRDSSPTGNDFLDQRLAELKAKIANPYLKYWISRENPGFTELSERLTQHAIKNGLLKKEQRRFAFIFNKEIVELKDAGLRNRLGAKIRTGGASQVPLDPKSYCLSKLLQLSAHTFKHVIPLEEWNKMGEPLLEESEEVDADLIQRICATVSHCCS